MLRLDHILLLLAGFFLLVNIIALTLIAPDQAATYWFVFISWCAAATIGAGILNRSLSDYALRLFPVVMLLSGWGLVVIARLLPVFALRQAIWLFIAVAAMLFVACTPYVLRWLKRYRYLLLGGGLALLLATVLFGRNPSGIAGAPQLWLGVGGIHFQPSELLKIILVAFLASYLAEQSPLLRARGGIRHDRFMPFSPRVLGPILLMWGLSILVLIWQRDLGAATLFFMVFTILLYVASGNRMILIGGGGLIVLAGTVAYALIPLVRLRIDIWLNPWLDPDGQAFQLVQSLQAFAAGGIFGQGVGQGSPYFVPVAHSDFVFAALAEEWGLLGVLVVLVAIASLIGEGLQIALHQQNGMFMALLAVGLTAVIATQSIMIMGGVLGVLPLTGVPLPFLSYGGSSLLMSFVMIGLLLRLSSSNEWIRS